MVTYRMLSSKLETKAQRLSYLLKISSLSQDEFAAHIGKTSRTLRMWISEKVPFPSKSAEFVVNCLKACGISCTKEWLENGEGELPILHKINSQNQESLFEHFNFDYSLQTLLVFHKRIYPNLRYLIVHDSGYAPRLTPQTLLISSAIPQEDFKEDWPHGYLLSIDNDQVMPVDIVRKESTLVATPFSHKGYVSKEYTLSKEERIYPIIVSRPIY